MIKSFLAAAAVSLAMAVAPALAGDSANGTIKSTVNYPILAD